MEHIVIDDSFVNSDLITNRGQKYPNISISRESIVKPSIASEQQAGNIFLENDNSFWKRAFQQLLYKGFHSMLTFTKRYTEKEEEDPASKPVDASIKCFYYFAIVLLFIRTLYLTVYYFFYPLEELSNSALLAQFSSNPQWNGGLIRAFEWHPNSLRCSLALVNDLIYVYSADAHRPINHICVLKNIAQKGITAMAWHPKREDLLAVAVSESGRLLLWTLQADLQQQTFKAADTSKCLQIVDCRLPGPVTSIVFDSEGKRLIACSPRSSSLSIVTFEDDLKKGISVRLVRQPFSTQMTTLAWSPDNRRLLALMTTGGKLKIYESLQWSSKCWRAANQKQNGNDSIFSTSTSSVIVQTAVWSRPSGRILLYAAKGSSQIYALPFYDKAEAGDVGGGPADSSLLLLDTADGSHLGPEQEPLGTAIQSIVWDRSSRRLAVLFEDKPQVIALYATQLTSSLSIWPLCTISPSFESSVSLVVPLMARFHDQYVDDGSLLTVCWSNGVVSHVLLPLTSTSINSSFACSSPMPANVAPGGMTSPRSLSTMCTSFTGASGIRGLANESLNRSGTTATLLSPETPFASPILQQQVISTGAGSRQMKLASSTPFVSTPRRSMLFSTRAKGD